MKPERAKELAELARACEHASVLVTIAAEQGLDDLQNTPDDVLYSIEEAHRQLGEWLGRQEAEMALLLSEVNQ